MSRATRKETDFGEARPESGIGPLAHDRQGVESFAGQDDFPFRIRQFPEKIEKGAAVITGSAELPVQESQVLEAGGEKAAADSRHLEPAPVAEIEIDPSLYHASALVGSLVYSN